MSGNRGFSFLSILFPSDSVPYHPLSVLACRLFRLSIGFFTQGGYSRSRMGSGFIMLDREIGIFYKTLLCIYNIT